MRNFKVGERYKVSDSTLPENGNIIEITKITNFGRCNYKTIAGGMRYGKTGGFDTNSIFGRSLKPISKFKVGDRVKCIHMVESNNNVVDEIGTIIKILGRYGVEFDKDINGHECGGLGKTNHCWWCDESDLVKVVCSDKIVITTDGKTTTAKMYDGKEVVKTAMAKCSPEDEFDFETGAKIAFDRLTEFFVEKSFDWNAFKNDEFFVQVTADNFESFVKAAEKHDCFFHNHKNPNPFKDEKLMRDLHVTSKRFVKPGDFFTKEGTVLVGYVNELLFTLHAVDNKPVHTW